ncbi:hypothetical protein O6H91_07G087700 [Diphasiastrum complanatum]|uniref:Uncharacterized protein n=1 Tax=Diphasiastrum complanatum TaxID=34168 RepID=A0ACC2D7I9_DIPCM|nr:hypothetical protein O6H91_07G087700 [Diphasiastrum complanatum]
MTAEQQRRILSFATSIRHLPLAGFAGLSSKFQIHKVYQDVSWLPSAHTCFYQLHLPPYSSLEMMYERLHTLLEDHVVEGFGFL